MNKTLAEVKKEPVVEEKKETPTTVPENAPKPWNAPSKTERK